MKYTDPIFCVLMPQEIVDVGVDLVTNAVTHASTIDDVLSLLSHA